MGVQLSAGRGAKCAWTRTKLASFHHFRGSAYAEFSQNSKHYEYLSARNQKGFGVIVVLRRGGVKNGVNAVSKIITLEQKESVRLDPDRLNGLCRQLGGTNAMDVLCRTVEELAVRLSNCERFWRRRNWADLRKCAKSLVAISDQVGMTALSRVAGDVAQTIDAGDAVATAATLDRLIRVGERSLTAIWDQQDLIV